MYTNRELSWLEFNERVLEEAHDKTNPLLERLKFLSITASNLDEFFMVRVSSLWEQENAGPDFSGMTPRQQLKAISVRAHEMAAKQYNCLTRILLPALEREGIKVLTYDKLTAPARDLIDRYFDRTLFPVITPMAIDPGRPFPNVNNRTVNILVELTPEDTDGSSGKPPRNASGGATRHASEKSQRARIAPEKPPRYAVVPVPANSGDASIRRVIPLPMDGCYILLEDVMLAHIGKLFEGQTVAGTSLLRVTRNSDLTIDEEEMDDLLEGMEKSIRRRRWGDPMRLELSGKSTDAVKSFLTSAFELEDDEIYEVNGPLDLTAWFDLIAACEKDGKFNKLRDKPLVPIPSPAFPADGKMIDVIRRGDVLVHHPYTSFDCVIRFVREAASDPQVLAIKQTLYRVSGKSPIIDALIQAAENGKQVTVLIELRARFDESNNIMWAKKLENAGVHVVYGLMGLKTHCKLCLVVRREDDGIRRYIHMGTGNYNDATAKIYTDAGYFTCRETFGQDASRLFNVLTGYSKTTDWQKFSVAPVSLKNFLLRLIQTEAAAAREGKPAGITAKMNSLSDADIIAALYAASAAGVKIRLLVRGICCLKPGVPGLSANITVCSIVDRFLEHTRIFYFENGERIFLSSADWMPRNMDRRVEVMFPVEDEGLSRELKEWLEISFSDNIKLRNLQPDGTYKKPGHKGKAGVRSQLAFYNRTAEEYEKVKEEEKRDVFRQILKREEG